MSRWKKFKHHLPGDDDPTPDEDNIWGVLGVEFDDDALDSADQADKERLRRIYEEEDRIEREKKLTKQNGNRKPNRPS